MTRNLLDLPPAAKLQLDNGRDMPFVIVADEAIALSEHVLRPYPRRNLNHTKRIFNYRLTRARRMVECAFGILASKWRIFHRPLDVNITFCDSIVKACCVLHNFVRRRDGVTFEDTLYECPFEELSSTRLRGAGEAISIRDYFAQYFVSASGSVPWQDSKV